MFLLLLLFTTPLRFLCHVTPPVSPPGWRQIRDGFVSIWAQTRVLVYKPVRYGNTHFVKCLHVREQMSDLFIYLFHLQFNSVYLRFYAFLHQYLNDCTLHKR